MQQTLTLPTEQVVLCFSEHQHIVQLPASFAIQYYPREDNSDRSAPIKITIAIGRNDWREFSLTITQARKLLYFLRKVVTKRAAVPHQHTDNEVL